MLVPVYYNYTYVVDGNVLDSNIEGMTKYVISLTENDTVVMLSPIYEGSEISATAIFNKIAKIGSKLVLLSKNFISPHASSEDLMLMIKLIQPKYYMPVKGEYRYMVNNANLASRLGIKAENIILKQNGDVATFVDGKLTEDIELLGENKRK